MPTIPDVKWNHADADAAYAALRRAADMLGRSSDERARAAQAAEAEWRGPERETFDGDLRRLLNEARRLAEEYRDAARRIAAASADARKDQARREHKRKEEEEDERRKHG